MMVNDSQSQSQFLGDSALQIGANVGGQRQRQKLGRIHEDCRDNLAAVGLERGRRGELQFENPDVIVAVLPALESFLDEDQRRPIGSKAEFLTQFAYRGVGRLLPSPDAAARPAQAAAI